MPKKALQRYALFLKRPNSYLIYSVFVVKKKRRFTFAWLFFMPCQGELTLEFVYARVAQKASRWHKPETLAPNHLLVSPRW
jgi:hypothetical protein